MSGDAAVFYLCQLETQTRRRHEFDLSNLTEVLGPLLEGGLATSIPWRLFRVREGDIDFLVASYARKLIVRQKILLTDMKRHCRGKTAEIHDVLDIFRDQQTIFLESLKPKLAKIRGVHGIFHFPVIVIDEFRTSKSCADETPSRESEYFDEFLTTFYFRVFDPEEVRVGFLRASVHQLLCLGLGKKIVQEIMGLVYEKLLYPWVLDPENERSRRSAHHATPTQIFDMFGALKEYTLSTELNIMNARFNSRLATYLGTVTAAASLAGALATSIGVVPSLAGLAVVAASLAILLFRKYFHRGILLY